MFVLKLSLRPWRLAPLSHLFSAFVVGVLLFFVCFLYWLQAGLKPMVARMQGEQIVTAYLDASVDPRDESKVTDAIRTSLGAHAESVETRFVGAQQFIENLKGSYPDLSRELGDLGADEAAVVPRYVSVAGLLPDGAEARIKSVPGVESVETSRDRYARVVGAFRALRWVARLLGAGVVVALIAGLLHLARINSYLHGEAFALLKLWGAGPGELRAPGMISGALVGALGGCLALAGWVAGAGGLAHAVRALSPLLGALPAVSIFAGAWLPLAGLGIGLLAGSLAGSAMDRIGAEPSRSVSGTA